jgi:TRAP-type C4-dicarboxylate transport system substrate-binding protein
MHRDNAFVKLLGFVLMLFACQADATVFKIATVSPDGTAWMLAMRAGADEIKQKTAGRVVLKFYPGGVMGDDDNVLRKIRIGQLQGGAVTATGLVDVDPDIGIYGLPYLFSSLQQVDYVRSRLDSRLMAGLEERGFVGFGLAEGGFTYMMSNRQLDSVEDVRKQKVWIPEGNKVGEAVFSSADISPVVLPLSDVLIGLQTGLIDTIITSPIGAIALQWHTRVSYVVDEPLTYFSALLVLDKSKFDKLTQEDQQIVRDIMTRVFKTIDQQNRRDNIEAREALIKQGLKFVPLSPSAKKQWHAIGDQAMQKLEQQNNYSKDIYDSMMHLLDESRQPVQ